MPQGKKKDWFHDKLNPSITQVIILVSQLVKFWKPLNLTYVEVEIKIIISLLDAIFFLMKKRNKFKNISKTGKKYNCLIVLEILLMFFLFMIKWGYVVRSSSFVHVSNPQKISEEGIWKSHCFVVGVGNYLREDFIICGNVSFCKLQQMI